MLDKGLTVIESRCRNDLSADSTVSTICADDIVSLPGHCLLRLGTIYCNARVAKESIK